MLTTEESDVTIASTTATQEELDHATGPNWREPFNPEKPAAKPDAKPEEKPAAAAEAGKPATKTEPASEPGKAGAKEGESGTEKDDELPPGARKRIDRLTARLKAAEAETERLRGGKPAAAAATPAPKTNADPEPQLKDFETWDKWNEARTRWAVRDENRQQDVRTRQATEQETVKQTFDSHLERVETYTAEHPDFVEKVESLDGFKFASDNANRSFQIAIVETDNGPEVLEYLADHPEEMDKFATYSPVKVQLAIGRISAALSPSTSEAKPAPTVPVSRTPAPTTPVRRSAAAPATRLDDPKLSTDEFIRMRNEQERNKRRH